MSAEISKRVLFTGQVQGVGFRWTTRRIAAAFPVTGFVRNLADGRVELVVTGSPAATAGVIREVCDHFQGNIESLQEVPMESVEGFDDFSVRR